MHKCHKSACHDRPPQGLVPPLLHGLLGKAPSKVTPGGRGGRQEGSGISEGVACSDGLAEGFTGHAGMAWVEDEAAAGQAADGPSCGQGKGSAGFQVDLGLGRYQSNFCLCCKELKCCVEDHFPQASHHDESLLVPSHFLGHAKGSSAQAWESWWSLTKTSVLCWN